MEHISQTPAQLLVKQLPRLPKGKALDIASGYGRHAFFLASNGYEVTGFDRSQPAVVFCNEKATQQQLPFSASCIDLENEHPFSEKTYDLVTCFYYLDRKIIPMIKKCLRIGGVIIYETFLIDQHHQFGKPKRSEFCWEHNECLKSFSDFRILFYHEGMIPPDDRGAQAGKASEEGTWVAQLVAERII